MRHAQIFCPFRRKQVALTPEEHVRQWFLHRLVDEFGYPASLIAVERQVGTRRYDAVVFSPQLQPLMLMEFKREDVALTQAVLDQASCYNRTLQVPYLVLSNGLQTIIARVGESGIEFLTEIPTWIQLSN